MINKIDTEEWYSFCDKADHADSLGIVCSKNESLRVMYKVLMDRSSGRLEDKSAKRNIVSSVPADEILVCVLRT